MDTFGARLRAARTAKELLQRDLGGLVNAKTSSISNWEKDQNYPDIKTIARICEVLEVTAGYLIEGNDKAAGSSPQEQIHIKKYRSCDERGRGMVDTVLDYEYNRTTALADKKGLAAEEETVSIQVPYESAAAGFGNYLSDDSYEYIDFPVSKVPNGTYYGIRITGDSMEPTIPNGAVAFIRSRPAIEDGKIGVFNLNGEGFCKRLDVDDKRRVIWLVSDNEKYEPIRVKFDDYLHTYGEVVGWSGA